LFIDAVVLEALTKAALVRARGAKFAPSAQVVEEVVVFHNTVVADGRLVNEALDDLAGTARALQVMLSQEAVTAMLTAKRLIGMARASPVVLVASVALMIVTAERGVPRQYVIDEFCNFKLLETNGIPRVLGCAERTFGGSHVDVVPSESECSATTGMMAPAE
jgi:hypothetical protein